MKKKVRLYITDLQLHARDFRPTAKFENTVKQDATGIPRGRIYGNNSEKPQINTDGTFHFSIPLPDDLQRQIESGEVELEIVMHEGGAPVYLSKDAREKMKKLQAKQRRQQIHTGRAWRKE